MKTITNINELSLPELYKKTIVFMVDRLRAFPIIKDIILFGGCARQDITLNSDIDLALVISESISLEEEWNIDNFIRDWNANIACDVIFLPEEALEREVRGETIVRPIIREGVRLGGFLCQRM